MDNQDQDPEAQSTNIPQPIMQPPSSSPPEQQPEVIEPQGSLVQEAQQANVVGPEIAQQTPSINSNPVINSSTNSSAASNSIILSDSGYLVNLFQHSVIGKTLSLYLYSTHLRIEDSGSGETIADVPLNQIKKVGNLWWEGGINIKTTNGHYRVTWNNRTTAFALFGQIGEIVNAIRGDKKSKTWIHTINQYKSSPNT